MTDRTPEPWKYGIRPDGSIWMSFGDPLKTHRQFDFGGTEADAKLVCAAPILLDIVESLYVAGNSADLSNLLRAHAKDAIKKAGGWVRTPDPD